MARDRDRLAPRQHAIAYHLAHASDGDAPSGLKQGALPCRPMVEPPVDED